MGKWNRSTFYKGILLTLALVSPSTLSLAQTVQTGKITVAWDPIQDPDLGGYTILWGQASGRYTHSRNIGIATEVTLRLQSGTTQYLVVRGFDKQGLPGDLSGEISALVSGNGDPNQDPNAPVKFTQITLSNVGNTSVTLNWSTDKPATGYLEYGLGTTFEFNSADVTLTSSHSIPLNDLIPSTVYRYRLTAQDGNGKTAVSGILMFKTSDRVNQPAQPSPEAIFIPSVAENEKIRTNLGINNLSESIANVSITLVDQEGMVLAGQTVQVSPKGLKQINSVARVLYADSLGSDVHGNLYLESDQPISAWASQIDNATNDPSLLLSKRTGASKILIPSAANISKFHSSLVVMNVGFTAAQVNLRVYGVNGTILGQSKSSSSIAPNGILSVENVLETLGVKDNYGPIEVSSMNNVPLVVTSRVSSASQAGGFFEGLDYSQASRVQIIPHVVDSSELRTNVGINNVSDRLATVTLRLIGKNGTDLGVTSVRVAPKGLMQLNNAIQQTLKSQGISGQEGYIRLESDQPIFGWASQINNVTNDPGFTMSKGQGTSKLLVQSAANVGNFRSSLVVLNTGDSEAIVDLVSYDESGQIKGESRGITIPAHGFFSSANILENLKVANSFGPVEIMSTNGQPLVATSRVYSTSGMSGFFEGQSVE